MSKLLEQAIAEARKLPEAEQELAAEALYSAISTDPVYRLTPAQADEMRRIRAAMRGHGAVCDR